MFIKRFKPVIVPTILVLALIAGGFGVMPVRALGVIRYVKWNAGGANNGTSWANAYTDLQAALSAASAGDEIWVAAGTYLPSTLYRTVSFQLKNNVALFGGFAGTETAHSQRNLAANITILSGDIGTVGYQNDNSLHVVTGSGTNSTAMMDGFTITGGYANEITPHDDRGGGMYNDTGSPTLVNITFSGNSAQMYGGGMYNVYSSPTLESVVFYANVAWSGGGMYSNKGSNAILTKVTFSNNSASFEGGGLLTEDNSNALLTDVTFMNNSAVQGGGMSNRLGWPSLTNVTFNNNTASTGGGMLNTSSGNAILINVTFNSNSASTGGGGIYNLQSWPSLTNVTFSSNTAPQGGGIYNYMGSPTIRNTILWGNTVPNGSEVYNDFNSTPTISSSVVQAGCPASSTCTNVITADPLLSALGNHGGTTLTIAIQPGSSAIDTGDNTGCPGTDQRGITRPFDGDLNGTAICDIGAYEKGTTFFDVQATYWALDYIERLYTAGVTGGCAVNPLMYCPEDTVTRAQMAVFVLKGKHGSSFVPPVVTGDFLDVPANYWAAAWIEQLAAEGITAGCGGGNFCPATPVTRDQMAIFLLKAKHGSGYVPPVATGDFLDVPTNYWAAAWIEQLAAEGITAGCGGGNYCPTTPVTRDQMAVFLVKNFNLP